MVNVTQAHVLLKNRRARTNKCKHHGLSSVDLLVGPAMPVAGEKNVVVNVVCDNVPTQT